MIVQVFCPTIVAEEKVNEFYHQVQFEIDKTCKYDMLLVIRGWKANIGSIKKENLVGLHGLGLRTPKWSKRIT